MRYKLETESEVDPRQRKLAHAAVVETCHELKLTPTPAIKFFREAIEGDDTFHAFEMTFDHAFGFTDGVEIFLRHGLGEMDLVRSVVHECRHVWQRQSPQWKDRSAEACEWDARLFELSLLPA